MCKTSANQIVPKSQACAKGAGTADSSDSRDPTTLADAPGIDFDSAIWAPRSATQIARLESDPAMVFVEGELAGFKRRAALP